MQTEHLKILIVEDEAPLRRAMKRKLSAAGFVALEATDGKEGLSVALGEHPDLILLDVIMPIMDGIEMTRLLREDEWGREARIIMLTNLNDDSTRALVEAFHVLDFLVKADWSMDAVLSRVLSAFTMKPGLEARPEFPVSDAAVVQRGGGAELSEDLRVPVENPSRRRESGNAVGEMSPSRPSKKQKEHVAAGSE